MMEESVQSPPTGPSNQRRMNGWGGKVGERGGQGRGRRVLAAVWVLALVGGVNRTEQGNSSVMFQVVLDVLFIRVF